MRQADYIEMTTTSIASSGAGAVTLTARTNIPTFSKAFGTQNTDVRYEIEDTVNNTYERGLGRVSSGVLTRTTPQITWDGTTWTDVAPSALTFAGAGSPTSGNIRIRIAPCVADKGANMVARQSTIAGDSSWRDYWISEGRPWTGNGSGAALTANQEYYVPILITMGGVLAGVQFEVTTNVAASNMKHALYNQGSDGLPGTKIVDFVTTATATTGIKTDTASASWTPAGKVALSPGIYWIGYLPSHAISIRCDSSGNSSGISTPLGRKNGYGFGTNANVAGSYSTGLPAIPSLGSAAMGDPGVAGAAWYGLKVTAS